MRLNFGLAIVISTLTLNGCAVQPVPRPSYSELPTLEAGWARVYVSAGKMQGLVKLRGPHYAGPVFVDNKQVGSTDMDEHFIVDLPPGSHEVYCSPLEPDKNFTEKRTLTFIAGQTYYLACDMDPIGAGRFFGLVGYLASDYMTKTVLDEKPLESDSRLVAYKKLQ